MINASEWVKARHDKEFENEPAPTPSHPFVMLEFKGSPVQIDEKIAPLIQAIWDCGIATTLSCQEMDMKRITGKEETKIWVGFPSLSEMERAVKIALVPTDREILHTLQGGLCGSGKFCYEPVWVMRAIAEHRFKTDGYIETFFSAGWYFPHKDLQEVIGNFRAYAAQNDNS